MPNLVSVQFLHPFDSGGPLYNKTEIAGFAPAFAARLIDAKIAVKYEAPKQEKDAAVKK